MTQRRRLTRRQFLHLSALATAGAVVTSCAPLTPAVTEEPTAAAPQATEAPPPTAKPETKEEATEAAPEATEAAPVSQYKQAPMLDALVASGDLPPVDERLPLNPYIIEVAESIGNYGGNIRRGFKGVSDRWGPTKHIDRTLVWVDQDMNLMPRLIESWEVSADAKTYTFHLRKGLKYSDGAELTSGDFKWFYDNYAFNEELQPSGWTKLTTTDESGTKVPCQADFPDDYTVVYTFAHPNPLFMYGGLRDINGFFAPGYFMKQYHMDLTDDKAALEAAVADAGFNSWTEYYEDRVWWYLNPAKPMATPWLAKNMLSEELFLMERNPYYFAVDSEGNQLPYIDTITHRLFDTTEVFNLWIVNGEVDFHNRHVALANYSLFKENEASGDYQVFLGISAGHTALQLNLSTKEPRLNEFFNTRDVRIAISHAMNRDEVNDLVFDGLQTPRQYSPLEESPNYYPKLSDAYLEYDPDTANQMLDDAGYAQKDADGYRTFSDGTTITFTIEGTDEPGSSGEDAAQLVVKYLNDVGIKAAYKYFERSLYTEHYQANEIEAAWWGGDRTVLPLAPGAPIFRGTMIDRPWAAGYGLWISTNGTDPNAIEPPADHFIWKIWDAWDAVAAEPDSAQQNKLFEKVLDIWAEELPMIGLLGEAPAPVIVKNGFHNYLKGMPVDDTTGDEHILQTESYFWDDPENHTA